MKKCASCSKDLPDAALHCVFCGAKQAPAPAVVQNHAKTAFGYSQNEVMEQLGNRAPSYAQPQSAPGRNPISPSEHDAATVLVPTTPQGAGGSFNNQQAYAATDYGSVRSPVASSDGGYGGGYGNAAPPPNAPYNAAPAPYGGPPPSGYGGAPSSGYGGAPSPGFGGPQSPGYGGAPPPLGFGGPQAPGYGGAPGPVGFGGAPAPAPAGYGGAPPPAGYGGPPAPAGYGGPPAPAGYGGAPAPAPGYGGAPAPAEYGGAPAPGYGGAQPPGYGGPGAMGSGGGGMGIHSKNLRTEPVPTASAPYRGAQVGMRSGWPIDPWKDSIKLVMFVWGAVALVTFAVPAHVDPMGFLWDVITDAPGKVKLVPLLWAAAGLLSIACAAIPMPTLPRGIVAASLGLGGILIPLFVLGGTGLEKHALPSSGMPPWQVLVPIVGSLLLIPGLLVRNEYTESIVPRILVTVGVVAVLIPLLAPDHSQIPLVNQFKGLIDAKGADKLNYAVEILHVVIVVMTLLAWMPGPATGGAKLFAWALILFPIVELAVKLVVEGHIGDTASKMPIELAVWAPAVVYNALSGYGLATIVGTQLE